MCLEYDPRLRALSSPLDRTLFSFQRPRRVLAEPVPGSRGDFPILAISLEAQPLQRRRAENPLAGGVCYGDLAGRQWAGAVRPPRGRAA